MCKPSSRGKQEMLKVTLFLTKQKGKKFAPSKRVAGKRTLRRKLRKNLLGPQAK